ncbi:MAG TPA: outer membrane protein transport protein [Polyangiaceae bacterium]|jgi:long-chain fatty acid transport protein|nr:outer membrane protein transport protein [Polyangiaceae bacterium]
MRTTKSFRVVLGAAAFLTPLALTQSASASGFSTARFGGEHGHPTTDNPTAIYYNPAGLAEDTPGWEKKDWRLKFFIDGNLALRWAGWTHAASASDSEPDDAKGANSGQADLFNVAAAPFAGASFQYKDLGIGLGFYVPFGGASAWGKNDAFKDNKKYAGPYDGVQRWHAIDGTIRSIYVSLGVAYDILDRVSIGVSGNLVMNEVKTIRARNSDGSNDIDLEGRSLIDVSGITGSLGVGIIGEIEPEKVWIGFSYQSQPGFGENTLEGTLTNFLAGSREDPADIKFLQSLPDIYRLGVRARPIKDVELRVFGDVTNWSVMNRQCVIPAKQDTCDLNEDGSAKPGDSTILQLARNWGPAFGVRVGGSYWVVPEAELFLGVGYDSNAIPDSTLEPALTDFHKASLAGGARVTIGETFAAALSYTHIFYAPRDTTGESVLPSLAPPSRTPDSGGEYTQTIGVINANVQLSF